MKLSIVVAVAANNVIGVDGGLPWHLPEDLRRFRQLTMGKPIVMGRLTHESIGRALPGRRNVILSRQDDFLADGCDVVASIEEALELLRDEEEVMIIGGGNIYEQFLPMAQTIYLTRVDADLQGDTFFPELCAEDWELIGRDEYPANDERETGFVIEELQRRA